MAGKEAAARDGEVELGRMVLGNAGNAGRDAQMQIASCAQFASTRKDHEDPLSRPFSSSSNLARHCVFILLLFLIAPFPSL